MVRHGGLRDRELLTQVLAGGVARAGNALENGEAPGVGQGLGDPLKLVEGESHRAGRGMRFVDR